MGNKIWKARKYTIDDEQLILKTTALLLNVKGTFHIASDGKQGLAVTLKKTRYDITGYNDAWDGWMGGAK